ncbi:MAG: SPOR domain-containing protein [Dysgonamonadaceae bacterium]|jgi:nucleoid DNA-binding protein|nr:SPOR domain-containing protein [Dysgonamonadaceae bacterium]
MQSIHFHIAYLLTKHECVIIPGFGAFIVSAVEAERVNRWGISAPPSHFLGFNSEVKHNDGLLVNSVAKGKNSSYNEANHLVQQFVNELHTKLNKREAIHIPWVGSLCFSDEQKIVFSPANNLSCNASYYGFTNFCLPRLTELQKTEGRKGYDMRKEKEVIWIPVNRRALTYTGSVAAAVLALFVFSTPLNNHSGYPQTQYAGMFAFPANYGIDSNMPSETIAELVPDSTTAIVPIAASEQIAEKGIAAIPTRRYFIIVASLPDLKSAKAVLSEFRAKGFEKADLVCSKGRYRIFINEFAIKTDAESFLHNFRKSHPSYSTAWLLSEKSSIVKG